MICELSNFFTIALKYPNDAKGKRQFFDITSTYQQLNLPGDPKKTIPLLWVSGGTWVFPK